MLICMRVLYAAYAMNMPIHMYLCRYCKAQQYICILYVYVYTQVPYMRDTHGLDLHTDAHAMVLAMFTRPVLLIFASTSPDWGYE